MAHFIIETLTNKWANIKALISDWDGVFNDGQKNPQLAGYFSEADSMGLNLLRYSLYLKNNQIPPFAIITGADNPTAIEFAKREKLQAVYSKILDKKIAFEHFCKKNNLQPHEVAFFFDDVNDLGVAKLCGVRFLIQRKSTPFFTNFIKQNNLADLITDFQGGEHAIREVCENIWNVNQEYEKIIHDRSEFVTVYQNYFHLRQKQNVPTFFKWIDGDIIQEA
jgi:3-deoxy-D-manno-octulosonate 8-phosphate phosphatase (KDO 8-P phosphatase)